MDFIDDYDQYPFANGSRYSKDIKTHVLDKRSLYSEAIKQKVNILSINPENTFFYGSALLASLSSIAGDYDIWELFKKHSNLEEVADGIIKIIGQFKKKQKFLIEFKCGYDKESVLNIGYLENNKIVNYNYENIMTAIKNKPYLKKITKYVKKTNKISIGDWMELYDENRKQYTLRWTMSEIMNNSKKMLSGNIITIEEGLSQPIITKIEAVFNIYYRFVGFSNYFDVGEASNDKELFKQSLQLNTLRMVKDKKYMKVVKRIFAQEKNFFNNKTVIETIYNFLISDVGRLNKVNNDIKAINDIVLSKNKKTPVKTAIKGSLDDLIDELSSIKLIKLDLEKIDLLLNKSIDEVNYKSFSDSLVTIIKYINNIVDIEALSFLKTNDLLPLKNIYIPSTTKNIMYNND